MTRALFFTIISLVLALVSVDAAPVKVKPGQSSRACKGWTDAYLMSTGAGRCLPAPAFYPDGRCAGKPLRCQLPDPKQEVAPQCKLPCANVDRPNYWVAKKSSDFDKHPKKKRKPRKYVTDSFQKASQLACVGFKPGDSCSIRATQMCRPVNACR